MSVRYCRLRKENHVLMMDVLFTVDNILIMGLVVAVVVLIWMLDFSKWFALVVQMTRYVLIAFFSTSNEQKSKKDGKGRI